MQKLCKFLPVLIVLCAVAVYSTHVYLMWPFTVDDAFITFRYAEHLAHHGQLLWNLNQPPVEGYTSFLDVLLITPSFLLHMPVLLWSKLIGLLSVVGIGLIYLRYAWAEKNPSYTLALSLLYAFLLSDLVTAIHTVSGLETPLYFFLFFSTVLLFTENLTQPRAVLFSVSCLLLGLTRPESNLYCLIMLISTGIYLQSARRKSFISAAVRFYILPGLLYFLWRLYYFQTFFPLPFYVKFEHNGLFPGFYHTLDFLYYYVTFLFVMMLMWAALFKQHKTLITTYTLIFLAGLLFNCHTLQIMGYGFRYCWPLISLILVSGLLLKNIPEEQQKNIVGLMCMALLIFTYQRQPWSSDAKTTLLAYANGLREIHLPLGKALSQINNQQFLVTCDAGAIPYYSKWPTIDSCALNNKIIATQQYSPDKTAEYIFAQKPRLVIVVSLDPHKNIPLPDVETLPIYRYALKAHMQILKVYDMDPAYYWIMGYPNDKALVNAINLR